jgi:hypothetical protein
VSERELAIVGGGLGGLLVGKAAAEHAMAFRRSEITPSSAKGSSVGSPIRSVRLLVGGESSAYSPIRGPFSEFLTLSGTDASTRAGGLDLLRGIVAEMFTSLSFDYEAHTRATKVTMGDNDRFQLHVCEGGKQSCFESEKLVLALGHALREVPPDLRQHVIRGGGELCMRLAKALPDAQSYEQCLEHVLSPYKRINGETIRIGLTGLGSSTFEVMKILDTLLTKPDGAAGKYRLPISGTPIELVVFEPHLGDWKDPYQSLLQLLAMRFLMPTEMPTPAESRQANGKIVERFLKFQESGQLVLVPERLEWMAIRLREGFIETDSKSVMCPEQLSVVIDCSPFEEGLGPEQRAVFEELDMVTLNQVKPNLWRVKGIKPEWQGRLAFAGAIALPKYTWSAERIEAQAKQIIGSFFGPKP